MLIIMDKKILTILCSNILPILTYGIVERSNNPVNNISVKSGCHTKREGGGGGGGGEEKMRIDKECRGSVVDFLWFELHQRHCVVSLSSA